MLDYTFMTDFFLTYRDFLDSADLCQLLVSRFYWALENDDESRRIVRIRTFVVLRHWLNNYFVHDFIGNRPLRIILTEFLNRLPRHPLVQTSPRDQRIVKILKRVVRRLKKLYYNRSSGASRVKVIAPPPPTAEQEHMGEIVRAKLSQNVIRRKTALGVDMSSHHNGNMAVQDARYAPVVVVGSLNMKGSFIDSGVDSPHNFSKLPFITQQPTQDSSDVVAVDDSQTIRSSVHHRYDKSVHQPVEAEVGHEANKAVEASSVASVASDDSLESELSAGETAPLESDESDDEDHHLHLSQEYYAQDDEHDRDWIREQQETLEYFKSVSKMALDPSDETRPPAAINTAQLQQLDDVCDVLTESPVSLHPTRPKIPSEFMNVGKEAASAIPNPKTVRRVPSERWCKTDDHHHPLHADHALPDELLKELSGDESQSKSPTGLSRKLSRKSIERRKSERSFHDAASPWHSAPSSAATSPYLTGAHSDDQVPQVPELPPLTPEMLDQHGLPKKRVIKKKKSGLKKKPNNTEEPAIEAFASIPYEATQVPVKASDQKAKSGEQPKRRLSRVLSKVFKPTTHHDEDKHPKETAASSSTLVKVDTTEEQKMQEIPTPQQSEQQQPHPQPQSSQLVSLIAQRLRHSSVDEGDDSLDEGECGCVKCSGNSASTVNCKRLSVMLIADDERRRSFELRRKRGASIDMDQQAVINHLGIHSNEQKLPKDVKGGPVYLGHLQARSLISSAVGDGNDMHDSSDHDDDDDDDDDDDGSTASFVPSERSIQTEAQASSSRARMSFLSEAATSRVPRSKMIELGIPPESNTSLEKSATDLPPSSIPRPMSEHMNLPSRYSGRCFIMSYRTSMLASQLCFVERDVLIKVGWEELIHCKWTKMDSSGNINETPIQQELSHGYDDEKINYTRQTEQRRTEEQGIEQVIQRFNTVCQWVSSEIVRTRNMNERVKLIEKFIRLAKKCKMYSNYATLVQILLGLQSPAVARLEKTWSKVSTKCQKLLSQLTEFTSPMKNWKNIRDSMTEVAEEYGNSPAEVQVEMPGTTANRQKFKKTTRIKIPFGGCIPFLGIYLSDLVFNSEKPRFLKPNLESQRIYSVNNTRNLPTCLDQPLVNFRKHRVIATVIKRVLTFQGLAMRYSFDEDGILLEKCRNLQVLDAAKIRDLSASLE
ncbi:unnamed protein product [Mucor fragilis]